MMFITQFHKVIRNKLIWGILLILIALVFIDWASSTAHRASLFDVVMTSVIRIFNPEHGRLTDAAATLDGKPITRQDYTEAVAHAQLAVSLMIGRPIEMNARFAPMVERLAWKRLATLEEVRRLGLTATEPEIEQALQANPAFQEEGRFSPRRFQAFLVEFLPTLMGRQAYGARNPQQQFETFRKVVAEELDMSRMRGVLAGAAWVAPLEVAQTFRQLHDTFLVSYVTLTPGDLPDAPRVTLADARTYYESHTNDFRIPERRRVRYVAFPIEDHLDVGGVPASTIESFYYSNLEKFSRKDSNGVPLTVPFEYVEDDIRIQLASEDAVQAAVDRARDFLDYLESEGDNAPPDFSAVADASGLTVRTTAFFTARSAPPDVPGADDDFTQAAFALGDAADGSASYPVPAGETYYILSLVAREDARIPDFDEVADKALRLAKSEAEDRALLDYAMAFRARAERQLAAGRTFDEIAAEAGLPIQTTEPFTVTSGMDVESDLFQRLMQQAILHNAGELTDPIPVRDGLMLAFVESRQPGDPTTFEAIRWDLARYMRQRKAEMLFTQWQESLLATNRFVSLLPRPSPGRLDRDREDEESDHEDRF
jgi:peptidyl-prolyl cis-trans isomerase D